MNSFELIPTEENLIHTLDKDLLKRNKDLVRFYDLILAQEGDSSIAIDGRWGSGKTFFVKQSMLLINAKNPMSDMDDEKKASIATVYKGNIIKNLIMDCQSYTKYRPNETTGGIFVSWRRKEELPTGA